MHNIEDIRDFRKWFEPQYLKSSEMKIPISFSVFLPSQDKNSKKINTELLRKVNDDIIKLFAKRFYGLTIIKGKGYWLPEQNMLDYSKIHEEEVQIIKVYKKVLI